MSTAQTGFFSSKAQADAGVAVRPDSRAWVLVRALGAIVVFLFAGEAMLRFDARTLFFQSQLHLSSEAKRSPELTAAATGDITPFARSFRVIVIGDSYLYGGGVAPEETFAVRLRQNFKQHPMPGFADAAVLDLTRPGANTYMNVKGFLEYAPKFQPHAVILAYNANDVYGNQKEVPAKKSAAASNDGAALEKTRSLRRLLFASKLVEFTLTKVNMELKHAGVIVPGTEFEHQVRKSHDPRYPGWIASQEHLRHLAAYCREHGIYLEVANMPDLSMLDNYKVYSDVDRTIGNFFQSAHIPYVNAAEAFLPVRGEKYAISRYDGHPNGRAHQIMAEYLSRELIKSYPRQ